MDEPWTDQTWELFTTALLIVPMFVRLYLHVGNPQREFILWHFEDIIDGSNNYNK